MVERQTAVTPARGERLARRSALASRSSFGPLQRFADEIDRVFGDFGFGPRWSSAPVWGEPSIANWAPNVDVFRKENELVIKADLPGLKKNDVSVDVTDDTVTIQGERRQEREEEHEGYYRSERSYGSFCRVIPLPEGAITEQAKATFRDGVLEISLPVPPASQGRRLEISETPKK